MAVLGWISAIFFLMLVIKYPLRKLGFYKANAFMMKLHEIASLGVFLTGFANIIIGIKNHAKDKTLSIFTGLIAYIIDVVIIAACHMTKDKKKKMRDHRILSLASCIALIIHIFSNIIAKKKKV